MTGETAMRPTLNSPIRFVLQFSLLCVLFAGCSSTSTTNANVDVVAKASGTPDHFKVGAWDLPTAKEPKSGEGCRNPMVDPRDGTRLSLIRSAGGHGDYEVPAGRYGVGEGQLLRLECATGNVIGVVAR
jgi:hypothetical protein